MVLSALILILSTAFCFFYLQATCQRILRQQFDREYFLSIVNANLLEFPAGPERFHILDRDTGRLIADKVPYKSGARITQIEPFVFQLSGNTHQGDRFLIRTIAPEPLEFTVHQGMIVHPVALFIEALKTRPQLQGRFGADADLFLAFILKHVFEKNEQDWLDLGDSGGYRFQARITDRLPNRIMPHNQYAALARAWLVLKDLDGVPPLMARRASQMVRFLHNHARSGYDSKGLTARIA